MQSFGSRPRRWLVLLAALPLLVAACDGADDESAAADSSEGGEFSMFLCEPERLLSQASSEVCGFQVLDTIFTGLVEYDAETGEIVDGAGMAESIESDDQRVWTITLKEGWTFHNGEPVTASSFVDAWNWMADPSNEMGNAFFLAMAGFEGYPEVAGGEAEEMSGVEAVDDETIRVTLAEPFGPFELLIGYTGFQPLPEEFYDDPVAFEDAPIGNGPYMMDGEWERGSEIRLVRYDDYEGEAGNADAVNLRIYSEVSTAFLDLQAGEIDLLDGVPPEHRAAAGDEFGDRYLDNPTTGYNYLGFPLYQEEWQDVNLRRSFSMAIDRETIIEQILGGTQTPATSIMPPSMAAHRDDACEYCGYDPDRAAELYAETDGVEEPLQLYFNSGAGLDEWMEAIGLQLSQNLGIEAIEFQSLDWPEYLPLLDGHEAEGPFRLGWGTLYPSPQYAMDPLYTTGAESNSGAYSSEEFDALIAEANTMPVDEADEVYQQAEDVLLEDMPIAPLWYSVDGVAWNDTIGNVVADSRGFVRIPEVIVD